MIDRSKSAASADEAPTGEDRRAEWHPYSVWREKIRTDHRPDSDEPEQNIELTGSWKPLAVWQRQIKRA